MQKKPPPDARILKIRDYEDGLANMQRKVQVCNKAEGNTILKLPIPVQNYHVFLSEGQQR